MPIAKMKTGETIEVPIEELERFLAERGDEIEVQKRVHRSTPDLTDFPFINSTESPLPLGQ
jgi:hypothetical protein